MTSTTKPHNEPPGRRRKFWLRRTLRLSQKEAAASATTTATSDNFFNAFAVYLNATAAQMGVLTAVPQLFGGLCQLVSVWVCSYVSRRYLIVAAALLQALVIVGMGALAIVRPEQAIYWLIGLAVFYFSLHNVIQPHWRAWMGSIVPQRRRGAFFAARTRLTMVATLLMFLGGGALLTGTAGLEASWLGFAILFFIAGGGRTLSGYYLWRMHDPDPEPSREQPGNVSRSLHQVRDSLHDRTFRHYSIFVAGMLGMVAISAPFFAVYMLRDLQFTYLEYSINSIASIATQFLCLRFWGVFSDRFGNRLVMLITSGMIPMLPLLWLVSPNFYYLLGVQVVSGIAWSGFSLSTANYLYDIRPHKTDFAVYAAVQSCLSAGAVFVGALAGGFIASAAPELLQRLDIVELMGSPLFVVFITSAVLRMAVTLWFIPRAVEPRVRRHPRMLEIVYRVARLNALSGVVLDWLTVTRKPGRTK
ncbi:MFS transporter [Marinimicrobium sp. ABcell2]|uniref:MFS transporter n=1 Tax=Marinimicrobium sp. ABcell2 TaxID=3069751 RepID=UPI0027ADBF3F|nr:MFS transporter [Marinimicrobium sp. ABcell2]MDQ2076920.1 MFS transporter [Marinimicrobium sp. ABcell2]